MAIRPKLTNHRMHLLMVALIKDQRYLYVCLNRQSCHDNARRFVAYAKDTYDEVLRINEVDVTVTRPPGRGAIHFWPCDYHTVERAIGFEFEGFFVDGAARINGHQWQMLKSRVR